MPSSSLVVDQFLEKLYHCLVLLATGTAIWQFVAEAFAGH